MGGQKFGFADDALFVELLFVLKGEFGIGDIRFAGFYGSFGSADGFLIGDLVDLEEQLSFAYDAAFVHQEFGNESPYFGADFSVDVAFYRSGFGNIHIGRTFLDGHYGQLFRRGSLLFVSRAGT